MAIVADGKDRTAAGVSAWTIAGLVLGVVAIGSEALVVSPVLEDVAATLGSTPRETGGIVAAYGLALALVAPLIGLLSDRFSRRLTLLGGLGLFALAGLGCALAPSLDLLLAARVACGCAAGAYLPSCYAYVGDAVPYDQRARVMGRIMFGWSLAMVMGVPLGGLIAERLGWRAAFVAVAGLGLVAVLVLARTLAAPRHRPRVGLPPLRAALQPAVVVLLLVNGLDMASFYGVYTYLGTALRAALGVGGFGAGLILVLYGAGLGLLTLNARLLDRIGKRRALALALAGLALDLALLPRTLAFPPALALAMVAWGMVQGACMTSLTTLVTRQPAEARGLITALLSCSTYLGASAGALAAGFLFERMDFGAVGLAAGGANLAGLLLCRFALPRDVEG